MGSPDTSRSAISVWYDVGGKGLSRWVGGQEGRHCETGSGARKNFKKQARLFVGEVGSLSQKEGLKLFRERNCEDTFFFKS